MRGKMRFEIYVGRKYEQVLNYPSCKYFVEPRGLQNDESNLVLKK